jgi:putative endonuclease
LRNYHVYVLASRRNGTLYVGVASDFIRRVYQHRTSTLDGFIRQHEIRRHVHVEAFNDVRMAIQREKSSKRWLRAWKVALIEAGDPEWNDSWNMLVVSESDAGCSGQARA